MRFINFLMVRFSLCLLLGIIIAHNIDTFQFRWPLFVVFGSLIVAWRIARKQVFQKVYFGIITYGCFVLLGATNYQLRTPHSQPDHFVHQASDSASILQLRISKELKPDAFNLKYIVSVEKLDANLTTGSALMLVNKKNSNTNLRVDDRLFAYGIIEPLKEPKNPDQFNYARYLKLQDIYGQIRLSRETVFTRKIGKRSVMGFASLLRNRLIEKLKNTHLGTEERSIIQALVLGHRDEIPKDLYKDYAAAGAVHMLAVSGLHVGILYFFLQMLLKPIRHFKYGRSLQVLLLILLLWGFALITGLAPSVTRAVTMFSFFGLAKLLNRPTNSINTLFLSFFFLLIINPRWLFHVGFQMSYLAVFFILLLQPRLASIYTPRTFIDRSLWDIITVSIAAQLGVTPLSLYYFHQFPGLFMLSNVVILPFLGLLVCFGIVIVCLAAFDVTPEWLLQGYEMLVTGMNKFVTWVAQQESFLIRDVHFSEYHLFGLYILIGAVVLYFRNMKSRQLLVVLSSATLFIGMLFLNRLQHHNDQLVLFHRNRSSLLGIKDGRSLTVFTEDTSDYFFQKNPIKNYRIAQNIKSYKAAPWPNASSFKGRVILIVDSTSVYPGASKVDIVILRSSPKLHLDRLIDSLQPQIIVADGSNFKSFVERWKATCQKRKLPFHGTGERGAFILE